MTQMVLHNHAFVAMGGPCSVHYWAYADVDTNIINGLLETEVRRLEEKYSRFRADSLLSQLNSGLLNERPLDDETKALLNYVDQCFTLSDQLFDPTIGVLQRVWNFHGNALPNPEKLALAKSKLGWSKLQWNGQTLTVPEGYYVDLGGVVKEFAADRLVALLKENQLSGLVNLAGDIVISGLQPKQTPWSVAIRHPRAGGAIAHVDIGVGSLAVSGDYERFMECEGRRYCHLIRPDTGYPPNNGLCSVSVIADNCLMAGAISSIAMLNEKENALAWLNELSLPYLAFDQSLNSFGSIKVSQT